MIRRAIFSILALLSLASIARADNVSSSALLNAAMDRQVPSLKIQGGLLAVMHSIESQTGVRVEASSAVWDLLPWGGDTTIDVDVKNATLRSVLDSVTRHLGLEYRLDPEAVMFEPSPGLRRLGRRATLDEIQVLELLALQPAHLSNTNPTIGQTLEFVDQKLLDLKSPFAIENRAFDTTSDTKALPIPRNASLMDVLEAIDTSTDSTWYPWGHSIVVIHKVDSIRLRMTRRLTRRFHEVDLQQVLLELSEACDVAFNYSPAVLKQIPIEYQRVNLALDDATLSQTLEAITGSTGLQFSPADDGIAVTFGSLATQPTTAPSTRP